MVNFALLRIRLQIIDTKEIMVKVNMWLLFYY
jgi:hypothetical protein